jgi:hypothetical protein
MISCFLKKKKNGILISVINVHLSRCWLISLDIYWRLMDGDSCYLVVNILFLLLSSFGVCV